MKVSAAVHKCEHGKSKRSCRMCKATRSAQRAVRERIVAEFLNEFPVQSPLAIIPEQSTEQRVCNTQQAAATKRNEEEMIQITAHLGARVLVKGVAVEALALIVRGLKTFESVCQRDATSITKHGRIGDSSVHVSMCAVYTIPAMPEPPRNCTPAHRRQFDVLQFALTHHTSQDDSMWLHQRVSCLLFFGGSTAPEIVLQAGTADGTSKTPHSLFCFDTDAYLPIYGTYILDNHMRILPRKGRGIQKALVKFGDLSWHARFTSDATRDILLNANVLMPETQALNPLWLSHMSDKLQSSFGDDATSSVVVRLER